MTDICVLRFFFFNDTATTEIYTLSLHDALPISKVDGAGYLERLRYIVAPSIAGVVIVALLVRSMDAIRYFDIITVTTNGGPGDRKSTRLNSSHVNISYAVFCLKKKKY